MENLAIDNKEGPETADNRHNVMVALSIPMNLSTGKQLL